MSDLKGKYPIVLSEDLNWGDMDAMQHINNCVYYRFFENALMAFFEASGMINHQEKMRFGPILASSRCDFRAPLTYPDTVQVAAVVEEIWPKRLRMKYFVYSEGLRKLAAEGDGMIVYYDYENAVSTEIPDSVLASINALQHGFVNPHLTDTVVMSPG